MGKRGQQRTPTELLAKRGSWLVRTRKDAPLAAGEIQKMPPEKMTDAAKAIWFELVPQLEAMGILGGADAGVLADYCEYRAEYLAENEAIRVEGTVVKSAKGGVRLNPRLKVRNYAWDRMRKVGDQLGLSPTTRANCQKTKATDGDKDSKAKFFKPRLVGS